MIGAKRALVVDESLTNRILFGRLLGWMGMEVVQAIGGADAIKVYEEDPSFDVVVLGSMTSGVDSITVTKLIRQFQLAKRPYIVGVGTSEASERALTAGMDIFMVRPGPKNQKKDEAGKNVPLHCISGGRS